MVRELLKHNKVDVNKAWKGSAPLISAVIAGRVGAVKELLKYKMLDVNVTDEHGDTAKQPLLWRAATSSTAMSSRSLSSARMSMKTLNTALVIHPLCGHAYKVGWTLFLAIETRQCGWQDQTRWILPALATCSIMSAFLRNTPIKRKRDESLHEENSFTLAGIEGNDRRNIGLLCRF
jgi:hypothetical protein